MLTGLRVQNPNREDLPELNMPIQGADGFEIVFIDGLDPVKSDLSSSPYANLPGEYFQNSRVGIRNIVLTLELRPSYFLGEDVEAVRSRLYGYFMPGLPVNMIFATKGTTRHISGIVETFEAPFFVQTPQVQISIICHDPYFQGPEPIELSVSLANDGFFDAMNAGDVPVGFSITTTMLHASATAYEYILSAGYPSDKSLLISKAFPAKSALFVDTNPGRKTVEIAGSSEPLMSSMVIGSGWPRLRIGPNTVESKFVSATSITSSAIVTYTERYAGL